MALAALSDKLDAWSRTELADSRNEEREVGVASELSAGVVAVAASDSAALPRRAEVDDIVQGRSPAGEVCEARARLRTVYAVRSTYSCVPFWLPVQAVADSAASML